MWGITRYKKQHISKKMSGKKQEQPMAFDIDNLFEYAMKEKWEEVERVYKSNPSACKAKLTKSKDTALHIAIASFRVNRKDASGHAEKVRKLVASLPQEEAVEILKAPNDKGDTPLHLAAALGSVPICKFIAREDRKQLISERNLKGETPLFLAACHGKRDAFLQLLDLYVASTEEPDDRPYRRNDGDTVLHSAISGEYFELAYQIIGHNPKLVGSINQEGFSPLHILARKPNVFESSSNLRVIDRMIYRCVLVRELKKQKFEDRPCDVSPCCLRGMNIPSNYQTCVNFIYLCRAAFRTIIALGTNHDPGDAENPKKQEKEHQVGLGTNYGPRDAENPEEIEVEVEHQAALGKDSDPREETGNPKKQEEEHPEKRLKDDNRFPKNYDTCIRWLRFAMTIILIVLGLGILRIDNIRKKKQKHKWAVQIMNELIKHEANYKYSHNGDIPVDNVDDMYQGRIMPPAAPPEQDTYSSSEDDVPGSNSQDKQEQKDGGKPGMGTNYSTHISDAQTKEVKETPIVPARMDTKETVKKILETSLASIRDLDLNGKNALLLTVDLSKTQDATTKDVTKETPLLLAAKMGISEVVKKILETFPVAIQDLDANGKNALLLAVEKRQNEVFDMLIKMNLPELVLYQVDNEGNSALHLAAKFHEHKTWRIPGAALQMQWEIKWYEHVKELMPPQFIQYNKEGATAGEILMKTHEQLLKDGSDWMIKTSESCSVVAALIATVAFATSSTIPGGVDQTSGRPILQKDPVFNIFSVTSIVALCFSVTALVFFLAILTSRCQQKDFKESLPRRLLFGLTSLFTSISAILISFCAGHFFTLKDQMRSAAFPIYAVACLPITIFAFVQLPLYFDLLWSIPRKVPIRSYEVYDD